MVEIIETLSTRDKNYKLLSATYLKLCELYNQIVGDFPEFMDFTRKAFPTGLTSIKKLEEELNKLSVDEGSYRQLCGRFERGWTQLFMKVKQARGVKK